MLFHLMPQKRERLLHIEALGEYLGDKLAGRLAIGIAIVADRIRCQPGIEIGRRCITEALEVFRCMALEEVCEVDLADVGGGESQGARQRPLYRETLLLPERLSHRPGCLHCHYR